MRRRAGVGPGLEPRHDVRVRPADAEHVRGLSRFSRSENGTVPSLTGLRWRNSLRFRARAARSGMVSVAQLVEPRIVVPAVAGSSPVAHPTFRVAACVHCASLYKRRARKRPRKWSLAASISPTTPRVRNGCIAQLVEQLTLNQRVASSILAAPTIIFKRLARIGLERSRGQ